MNIGKVSSGKNVAFCGYQKVLDDKGANKFKFFYPYDTDKYTCSVCVYDVEESNDGAYPSVSKEPKASFNLDDKGYSELVDIHELFANNDNDKFAYRFELKDKNGNVTYAFDPGITTNILYEETVNEPGRAKRFKYEDEAKTNVDRNTNNKYNIVSKDRVVITKGGKMQLIMPDEYYPGIEKAADGRLVLNQALRNKALASVRTHINKLGGNLNGIIERLPELEKEGFTRIVGMPITKDTISSHLYWTQNAYQVAPQLGSTGDLRNLNVEMYKHGMNWVSDAALVNEGFCGIHLSNVLRWGKESPFFNWFKINGLDNGPLMMGVLTQNPENGTYRLVNSPFNLKKDGKVEKNDKYDPHKPTYVQIYDKRMATEKQVNSDGLILTYDKNNTDNHYEITGHDDVIYPYYYEIDPRKLDSNISDYKKHHKGVQDFYSPQALISILQFENFKIDKKAEGGFVAWDGNVDIAKLNFYQGNKDQEVSKIKNETSKDKEKSLDEINAGILQVQDYAIQSGRYWTKLVADNLIGYTAEVLGDDLNTPEKAAAKIDEEVKKGKLPKAVSEKLSKEVINNIYDDSYDLNLLNRYFDSADEYIERMLMEPPLEVLPFANNLLGAMTSAYIAKRATSKEELGMSRFDFSQTCKDNLPEKYRATYDKMDKVYEECFMPIAKGVLSGLGFKEDEFGGLTNHGKYVANDIVPEISQYLIVKSLFPSADIRFKDGHVDFSHVDQQACSLNALEIHANSPKDEAEKLVNRLLKGASQLNENDVKDLVKAYSPRISKTSEMSYKLADAIVDRTESGLGWRIDASKDIASIDSVRENTDVMKNTFEDVIDFWKNYNKAVTEENHHVYTAAEVTDMGGLIGDYGQGRFKSGDDAETKFLQETGITTTANYTYFFSSIPKIFGASGEDGNSGSLSDIRNNLVKGYKANAGFLFQLPLDGILHSYTFVGNHDKPRILHSLGLDMKLFYSDFSRYNDKYIAAYVLGKDIPDIDFDAIKGPAIAMGKALKDAFAQLNLGEDAEKINKAISTMAGGEFKGKKFNPEAFGARSFDIVIDEVMQQANYTEPGLSMSSEANKKIQKEALGVMLKPAFDKYYSVYKFLMTLPGDATDFAGDSIGATGYETKTKNYFQQNRNPLRWEWLDDPQRDYIKTYNNNIKSIMKLRDIPECSALNDGIPVVLPTKNYKNEDYNTNVASVLRYNDKGSIVVTTYTSSGAKAKPEMMSREPVILDSILLNTTHADGPRESGLVGGVKVGMKFKNANPNDNNTYVVKKFDNGDDGYYIENENAGGKIIINPDDYNALVLYKVD